MSSLIPDAIREAKSARVGMSLFLLSAFVVAAYVAGRDAGRGISETKIDMLIESQAASMAQIAASTKSMEILQQQQGQMIMAIDGRVMQLNGNVSNVSSRVEDLHRKR